MQQLTAAVYWDPGGPVEEEKVFLCYDTGCQLQWLQKLQAAGRQSEPVSQSEPDVELRRKHQPLIQTRNGSLWFRLRQRTMHSAPEQGQEQGVKYSVCAQQSCEMESRNIPLQINNCFLFYFGILGSHVSLWWNLVQKPGIPLVALELIKAAMIALRG